MSLDAINEIIFGNDKRCSQLAYVAAVLVNDMLTSKLPFYA